MTKAARDDFGSETILAWYFYPEPNGTPYYAKDLEDPKHHEDPKDHKDLEDTEDLEDTKAPTDLEDPKIHKI